MTTNPLLFFMSTVDQLQILEHIKEIDESCFIKIGTQLRVLNSPREREHIRHIDDTINVERTTRTPEDYGLARCKPEDLAGGDAEHNAKALADVCTSSSSAVPSRAGMPQKPS